MPPVPVGRKFNPWDPEIAAFIGWFSTSERETWLSYLVLLGMREHLSQHRSSSPFNRGTHLDTRVLQFIYKFAPGLNSVERISFRFAVQTYIRDMKLIGEEFDYSEPPPKKTE